MKITFENVSKQFKTAKGSVEALKQFSLEVRSGEFFIFLGPSGCGKSTLLNLAAGLEAPSSGAIRFGETAVASVRPRMFMGPGRRNVAMVFQSYALYPHLNVRENIAFPLRNQKKDKQEIVVAVKKTADMLGIADLLDRKPGELSGGQRQRVAIARAVVRQPAVFLLDEPLSNLDAQLRTATRAELKRLQQELGVTTLYVTHDQTEAMTLGDRVALLKDGNLLQVGTPTEIYHKPSNAFVATFIGAPPMNLLSAEVRAGAGGAQVEVNGRSLPLPPEVVARVRKTGLSTVQVGIRPEHVRIDPAHAPGAIQARINSTEPLGRETIYRLHTPYGEWVALGENREPGGDGLVSLSFDPAAIHIFTS
jgi:multiple sugar transport system ATP-binding protein